MLGDAELKDLLIQRLSKYLDGEIHSVVDLSMRDITGDKGSLCGIAAFHQAARDTFLSISQLNKMSFESIKFRIAEQLGTDPTTVKATNDIELLEKFYECEAFCLFSIDNPNEIFPGSCVRSDSSVTYSLPNIPTGQLAPTSEDTAVRSYGSVLSYQCGLARQFYEPELGELYQQRNMTCNWNTTWTLRDSLDECVWTQCLYPPEPPELSLLTSTWSGQPVEFHENVSYVCQEEETYFQWDRDQLEFNVTCQPDGSWPEPEEWPVCLSCK